MSRGRIEMAAALSEAGRPAKRSLRIAGHATSVRLEPPFWAALEGWAAARGLSLAALVTEIDAARPAGAGLAAALRCAVLAAARAGAIPDA